MRRLPVARVLGVGGVQRVQRVQRVPPPTAPLSSPRTRARRRARRALRLTRSPPRAHRRARALPAHSGVPCVFTGFLRGLDLFSSYASGDVFVSACVTEAFPLCYLEAMSAGCCVVGPNAGGVPSTFDDDVHGFLYEAGNNSDAAAAIVRAIDQRERLVAAAVPHARSFTWERSVSELEQCYKLAATPFICDESDGESLRRRRAAS